MLKKVTLMLVALLGMPLNASAKPPTQVEGCPRISFFHGADKPNAVAGGYDRTTWLTYADNSLTAKLKPQTLDQLAKRWKIARADLDQSLCYDGAANVACETGLVSIDNDGFADTYALAIMVTPTGTANPTFLIHERVCTGWEKERVGTFCRGGQTGDLAYIHYTVAGGDDDDDEDDLVWDQVFDAKTGKLLLSSSDAPKMAPGSQTPGITIGKGDGKVSVGSCASWSAQALRAGQAPNGKGGAAKVAGPSAKVRGLITAGRKATKAADYPAAIKAFTEAIAADSGALKAWSGRGYAHLKASQPTKALADFQHLLDTHAGQMDARFTKMVKHNVSLATEAVKASKAK
ncbi:MAG: tetratricopeptide (TPR) repeat protein [Myxococcota bacterium]|jgi:tetratricopeptide (TPR) repeat protein